MSRHFNGTTDYLLGVGAVVAAKPLTVAAWIYPDTSAPAEDLVIWTQANATDSHRFRLLVEQTIGKVRAAETENISSTNAHVQTLIGVEGAAVKNLHFDGRIGHVAVWSVALADAEIDSLARGAPPRQVRPGSLVAYWALNGGILEVDVVGRRDLVVVGATVAEEPSRMLGPRVVCA